MQSSCFLHPDHPGKFSLAHNNKGLWAQGPASSGWCSCYLLGPSIPLCFPFVTLYYLHKGPSNSHPTVLQCPVLAFPKLLYSLPLSPSLVTLHPPAPIPVLPDFHHSGQHATCSGCGWWLVPSPSLTFPFIPSNLGRVSLSFLLFLVLHRIPLSAHLG